MNSTHGGVGSGRKPPRRHRGERHQSENRPRHEGEDAAYADGYYGTDEQGNAIYYTTDEEGNVIYYTINSEGTAVPYYGTDDQQTTESYDTTEGGHNTGVHYTAGGQDTTSGEYLYDTEYEGNQSYYGHGHGGASQKDSGGKGKGKDDRQYTTAEYSSKSSRHGLSSQQLNEAESSGQSLAVRPSGTTIKSTIGFNQDDDYQQAAYVAESSDLVDNTYGATGNRDNANAVYDGVRHLGIATRPATQSVTDPSIASDQTVDLSEGSNPDRNHLYNKNAARAAMTNSLENYETYVENAVQAAGEVGASTPMDYRQTRDHLMGTNERLAWSEEGAKAPENVKVWINHTGAHFHTLNESPDESPDESREEKRKKGSHKKKGSHR